MFVRRAITRPAQAGGEAHEAMARDDFMRAREAGGFALWWAAHGLLYGIPHAVEAEMAAGRVVIANLSRGVLADAARRYRLRVLEITAPDAVLAARLAARGREDATDQAARITRVMELPPGTTVTTILNVGAVEEGIDAVLATLNRAAQDARRS